MDNERVGRYWEANAEAWTELVRAGYDHYRDGLNTPAFMGMLPDVEGLSGLDIGCGEGHNTRLVARRGAKGTGIDISETFIRHAREEEERQPLGIRYRRASAVDLPFGGSDFDFAVASMSLMDIPETDRALAEALRVVKPGGFLQFSILHPCYDTPHRRKEWSFAAAPPGEKEGLRSFRTPLFTRTVGEWMNLLVGTGFGIERVGEPYPDDDAVRERPGLQDAQVVACSLHVRARKPA